MKVGKVAAETDKATLFSLHGKEFWLPNAAWSWLNAQHIITTEWLAKQKRLDYKPLLHVPEPIEPEYKQEPVDELRY